MRESEYTRREFWKKADFKSFSGFTNSVQQYRDYFWDEIIGRFPKASLPPNPRSRFLYETNGYRGYEVVLDVHPDVFAYGILSYRRTLSPAKNARRRLPARPRRPAAGCSRSEPRKRSVPPLRLPTGRTRLCDVRAAKSLLGRPCFGRSSTSAAAQADAVRFHCPPARSHHGLAGVARLR